MKTFAILFSLITLACQSGVGRRALEFLNYFGDVFTPVNFGLLMIGTIGGLILGATPGLSPTMAVALLCKFGAVTCSTAFPRKPRSIRRKLPKPSPSPYSKSAKRS